MLFDMKVRTRLAIIAIFSVAALIGMGIIGLINGSRTSLEIDHVYQDGLTSIEELQKMQETLFVSVILPLHKLQLGTTRWTQTKPMLNNAKDSLDRYWKNYVTQRHDLEPALLAQQKVIISSLQPNLDKLFEMLKNMENPIKNDNSQQLISLVDVTNPILENLHNLFNLHSQDALYDYQQAQKNAFWFQITTLISLIVFVGTLVPITLIIISTIVKPIEYAAKAIDTGDTKMNIDIMTGGELGNLLKSVQHLFASLNKISNVLSSIAKGDLTVEGTLRSDKDVLGSALQGMVRQTRLMIGDIKQEVAILASSSHEIMRSLTLFSAGAAETASAVTETTTTIEELKQTANISVEKAKDVLSNAEDTLRTVKATEHSVMAAIEDMTQIRERMQTVSDSILKLSEKSLAIAQIIDSVSDIAEQSNLLAVNAAIESAKAGEYGRSFGVVAQEIRTLAEQSKTATVQVKALLGDIQTATNAAVLATEQGSKAVTKGVSQSTETTQNIKELANKMAKVTQATNQIVLSNQQQLIGTEQITVAMSQINEASNEHVGHLRQIEEAVSKLSQVGGSLKGLTDRYRIAEEKKARSRANEGFEEPVGNLR